VAKIETLGFFGEGALIAGDEPELRTATVTVTSEKCVLLRLKRCNFLKLMKTDIFNKKSQDSDDKEGDDDNKSIIEQMKETRRERSRSNRLLMQNRNSGDLLGGGGSTNTRSLFYEEIANTSTTGVDL
jgi:hypothetical protein